MVSKRQRLARKRFKDANPDLFPVREHPKDDAAAASKKKEKKEKQKNRIKAKNLKKKLGKHPLRVPGMRPGENCFICKASDHIAKLCPEKSLWEKNKICLFCRQRGHSLKRCPGKNGSNDEKLCYNCGESGHSLSKCPIPLQDGGAKFAECFVCKERGHLSKDCPKNMHGIYPKGGSCKICGGVNHLAKHCPNKGNKSSVSSAGPLSAINGDEVAERMQPSMSRGGDDLEDDFLLEDAKHAIKGAVSHSCSNLASTAHGIEAEKIHIKAKKKQGPKVVNFF